MSSLAIAVALRAVKGWRIELHTDHLDRGVSDVDVIEFCASKGWALVSVDDRIRYVPANREAAERHGLQVFMLVCKNDTVAVRMSSALIAAQDKILRFIKQNKCGFFAHVYLRGAAKIMSTFDAAAFELSPSQQRSWRKYGQLR